MPAPIKIGTFVPFSGPPGVRVNGPRMHAGTAASLALLNDAGGHHGRPIVLIAEDSGYDTQITAAAARKLVEDDQVFALLNANGTPQISAALPYLHEHRMPVLLPFGGADDWYHPPRAGLLGLNAPFNDIGHLLGRWAAADGHRRVVVFHPDYPAISPLMAEHASHSFQEACRGGTVQRVCVPLGSTDGVGMADSIEQASPEAIIVLTNWPELLATLTELRNRGRNFPLYSWSANVTQEIAAKLGELIEGMKGYSALVAGPLADTVAVRRYRDAMAREFPTQAPDFMSLQAFAQTEVFAEALSRVRGALTQDALFEAFYTLDRFETGILPPVTFTRHRHVGIDQVQPVRVECGIWTPAGSPETLPLEFAR